MEKEKRMLIINELDKIIEESDERAKHYKEIGKTDLAYGFVMLSQGVLKAEIAILKLDKDNKI